jgi:hypothetical protein
VFGVPFSYPPGPPIIPNLARASVTTSAGVIDIDTITIAPGPPGRFTLPNLVVISIHPPSPCRAKVTGTTVVFTPVIPPGPPG